jgi:uncharacterized RDD family membrane protein YckC
MISDAQLDSRQQRDAEGFSDQLSIETPELVSLNFSIAGIGSRFLAIFTDTVVQTVCVITVMLLAAALPTNSLAQVSATAGKWFVAAIFLFFFLLYWGYFSLFEAFWNGQTPGKALFKIRVIKDSGRQVTLFETLARNLLRPIDYLPGFYLAGVITMLCNKQQKRIGDLVAGTIVVHETVEHQPLLSHNSRTFTAGLTPTIPESVSQASQQIAVAQNASLLPADAIARLNHDDLNVLDAFFSRALDLDLGKRAEMASRIAARMCAKMQIPVPDSPTPERLLEAIAHAMRAQGRH